VASGIAHYYGLDVSLVRIIFVLLTLGTGFGLLAYLLAWLIIPRAEYWPPAPPPDRSRSLGRRDLGLLLTGAGLLLALAFGGGAVGSFLAPALLIGGGVWLLLQPANGASGGVPSPASTAGPTGSIPGSGEAGGGQAAAGGTGTDHAEPFGFSASPPPPGVPPTGVAFPPHGAPVPPRSRGRRFGIAVLVVVLVGLLVLPLLFIAGIIALIATNGIDLETTTATVRPATVSELPRHLSYDEAAELTIDLTELSAADFDDLDETVELDVDVDAGQVEVLVPDDLEVSVDAHAGVGQVAVFGRTASGIGNDLVSTVEDADLDLTVDLGVGEVRVTRSP
jgi:hypothetical protein